MGDLIELGQRGSCVRQPELFVLIGVTEHRVRHHAAVGREPWYALLDAAKRDRLRLSAVRLDLGKSGLHVMRHDDILPAAG